MSRNKKLNREKRKIKRRKKEAGVRAKIIAGMSLAVAGKAASRKYHTVDNTQSKMDICKTE